MNIAESLYNKGLISYPRTETTHYHPSINIKSYVKMLETHDSYGQYVENILKHWNGPRNGTLDDKSHPPIHPVNYNITAFEKLNPMEV